MGFAFKSFDFYSNSSLTDSQSGWNLVLLIEDDFAAPEISRGCDL
jgi:hypothetical protein